jgi:hypothetical protein
MIIITTDLRLTYRLVVSIIIIINNNNNNTLVVIIFNTTAIDIFKLKVQYSGVSVTPGRASLLPVEPVLS